MPKIYLIDVTNRDGVQTANLNLAKLEKTMINYYLNQMGVWQSEFGFPTTKHEINYLRANLALAKMGVLKPIRLSGWIRAVPEDVRRAIKLVPEIKYLNLSISTSNQMIKNKFRGKLDKASIISEMTEAVRLAKELGIEAVGVNAEDASRSDLDYLVEFALAAKEAGADRIRYCDTLGFDTPFSIYDRILVLAKAVNIPIELHCHNDLGMAEANSLAGAMAAIDGGVDAYINTTINGIGERAGNADLVATILAIQKANLQEKKYILDSKVDLSFAWIISKYTSKVFDIPIPINQPGVGANAFAHSSGIHADGVLKDPRNYELYDFLELGRGEPETVETGREIVVGQYIGTKGFQYLLGQIGIEIKNKQKLEELHNIARQANVSKQKALDAEELRFIVNYPKITKQILTVTF